MTETTQKKAPAKKATTTRRKAASKAVATKGATQGQQVATMDGNAAVSQMIEVIERVAMNPDVDVIKMEKLLDMQERILDRQAQQEFDVAMANMQPHLPVVEKRGIIYNKDGKTIRSKYAKFEDINKAVKPILCDYGFSMTFSVQQEGNEIAVTGILSHKAGHRETTSIKLGPDVSGNKNAVQAVASSVSYGKRYVMSALLNLIFDEEDDDAETAVAYVTEKELDNLQKAYHQLAPNIQEWVMNRYEGSLENVPRDHYAGLLTDMNARIRKGKGRSSRAESIVEGQVIDHE